MTSQLNVDTIVDKAGSGGTNVKIANTSVTVAEGGSGTTNTVQGLIKCMIHFDTVGSNVTSNTLNISSFDDDGTGDHGINFSSNFSNANYVMTHAVNDGGASTIIFSLDITYGTNATSATDIEINYVSATDNRTLSNNYGGMLMIGGSLA